MNFLIQTVLSPTYRLIAVSDVYQGMNELKSNDEIELIIIDIDYHTQENWDFIQHVKTSGFYNHTPVMLLTSNANLEKEEVDLTQIERCFYKPFRPHEMTTMIDELMMKQGSVKLMKS